MANQINESLRTNLNPELRLWQTRWTTVIPHIGELQAAAKSQQTDIVHRHYSPGFDLYILPTETLEMYINDEAVHKPKTRVANKLLFPSQREELVCFWVTNNTQENSNVLGATITQQQGEVLSAFAENGMLDVDAELIRLVKKASEDRWNPMLIAEQSRVVVDLYRKVLLKLSTSRQTLAQGLFVKKKEGESGMILFLPDPRTGRPAGEVARTPRPRWGKKDSEKKLPKVTQAELLFLQINGFEIYETDTDRINAISTYETEYNGQPTQEPDVFGITLVGMLAAAGGIKNSERFFELAEAEPTLILNLGYISENLFGLYRVLELIRQDFPQTHDPDFIEDYSNGMMYVSRHLPKDPKTGKIITLYTYAPTLIDEFNNRMIDCIKATPLKNIPHLRSPFWNRRTT